MSRRLARRKRNSGLSEIGRKAKLIVAPTAFQRPPMRFDAGLPERYEHGIDTRWKDEHGVVIVREGDEVYALSVVCTHLGCPVDVVRDRFACPCHGSLYSASGAVLKGPTERPLERVGVSLSPRGTIVVDKTQTWSDPEDAPVVHVPAEVSENQPGACDPDDEDCMNVVYTHPSGAKLWQGGNTACRAPGELERNRIRCVVLAATEFQPKLPSRLDVIRAHLEDRVDMDSFTTVAVARCADEVSDLLAERLRRGQSVLSSCWAGWNRSGLITALTIAKATGCSADHAIALVRRARGPYALSNQRFVEIVKDVVRKRRNVRR